ncbi:hypothetical protein MMC19_001746 [Ptychographa xylographoides]|nr:hypothetical protein [Ptychographa xylographoides]
MGFDFGTADLAKVLHSFLVRACQSDPRFNYKGGIFANYIVMSRPLMSCVEQLYDSNIEDGADRYAFGQAKRFILKHFTPPGDVTMEMMVSMSMLLEKLRKLFIKDWNARHELPEPADSGMWSFLDEHAETPNYVLMHMVQMVRESIVKACAPPFSFKGGIFDSVGSSDALLHVLAGDERLKREEREIFREVADDIKFLYNLGPGYYDPELDSELVSKLVSERRESMQNCYETTFGPMWKLFDADCNARGIAKPDWCAILLDIDR